MQQDPFLAFVRQSKDHERPSEADTDAIERATIIIMLNQLKI